VAQSGPMDTALTAINAALAEVSDTELAALIAATYGVPQTALGLLGIDGALEWPQSSAMRCGRFWPHPAR